MTANINKTLLTLTKIKIPNGSVVKQNQNRTQTQKKTFTKSSNKSSVKKNKNKNQEVLNALKFYKQKKEQEKFKLRRERKQAKLAKKGIKSKKSVKKRTLPVIAPKSLLTRLKSKNKVIYDRKFIDVKNKSLLQEYIRFDGKILPRRKTKITTKQHRYLTKAIKTARILSLLPFVKKEKGFFR
uniref:ribosomal protein S18 n=1 Tax=Hydrocytium acuminatum TaxID=1745963 RepID=UPI002A82A244|nr:ribosomal protein S18 [Hydrocytium acuminatum]WOR09589.1 ribosomal protein S18 [Hydrocytium acuminatum]